MRKVTERAPGPDLPILEDDVRESAPAARQRARGMTMGLLRYRTQSGELKFWTVKEIVQ